MSRFIYYVSLIIFIFVLPHSIGETNFFPLKAVLFILFFVAPVFKLVNKAGEPVEKVVNKFKEIDDFKKDKFKI